MLRAGVKQHTRALARPNLGDEVERRDFAYHASSDENKDHVPSTCDDIDQEDNYNNDGLEMQHNLTLTRTSMRFDVAASSTSSDDSTPAFDKPDPAPPPLPPQVTRSR